MEKKNYQKPDMRVVMMKYHGYLLEGTKNPSGPDGGARSHRMNDDE